MRGAQLPGQLLDRLVAGQQQTDGFLFKLPRIPLLILLTLHSSLTFQSLTAPVYRIGGGPWPRKSGALLFLYRFRVCLSAKKTFSLTQPCGALPSLAEFSI